MLILKRLAIVLAAISCPAVASGTEIGVAAPLSGPFALLGGQMRDGANAALSAAGANEPMASDTECSGDGGRRAAEAFVTADVRLVVGFLCIEAIEAALPILTEAGIPVITTGVRINALTDRRQQSGWSVFRLAPRADEEAAAVGRIMTRQWAGVLFAIIDDGTIYGRELAESFRLAAELGALKPVFTDTFRPQLTNQIALAGRLRKAGATHVFAGGDRSDLAILGRDAAELGYDLVIAGGEALRAAEEDVDLVEGTLMVGLPVWADVADPAALAALDQRDVAPDGYVLPTYAAAQVALAVIEAAVATEITVEQALATGRFDTALGEVRFNDVGDWAGTRYRLFRYDGKSFRRVDQE
ncbi:ABC transporter substrate-binding protein [Nitratireductor mangrovi]|uniref:ABC transporter substrate-binding protein n=1 Tax=Nitratireductor mangrovi TaxID=2599600 RepID=A0A5B8KVE2_9HYPH|nr:branched-chain amino acid ABC transporter substrate-binding protein [Nitratireductor mangrovi]QDY99547.1 ABC transporter substrate-binding protein [Nitratireductor mangrovi]